MAVALVAASTSGATDAQTSSRTVPVPAGATSAHVVVIDLEIWLDTSTDPTITWPTGFTQIGYVESATDGFTRLYRAISTDPTVGQSGGNYSMSWSGSYWNQAQASLWSGVDQTTPQDVATDTEVTASNRNHAACALTTGTAGCGMLFGTANENNATATAPTGYTQQQTANYLKTYTKIAGSAGAESITAGANPWSVATVKVGLLTALRPASGGGSNNTAAGPATETDAAQAVGRTRTSSVTSATETDTAQAAGRTRTSSTSPAAETDTAQAVGRTRNQPAGTALETDTAQPISSSGGTAAGPATETDTAQPVGRTRTSNTAPAPETDQAQPVARTRTSSVGTATETDTAQTAARTRTQPAGPALETDTAQAVTNPNEIILELLLEGLVEAGPWRVAVEADRYTGDTEPDRWRMEVEA